ncbi:fasciclin domain-containing protein [Cesiribacter sp. SM1]|uniref:fasciclin domain-containing protein n=1 Tax=Cesiribacter sp. SM1 TaxID=2861196 RepID=UPI001CD35B01|nr:fasciclin domain-containing protein [Cesiribacter sp. SM1]
MKSKLFALPTVFSFKSLLFIFCLLTWSCDSDDNTTTIIPGNTVLHVIRTEASTSTFSDAVNRTATGTILNNQNTRFTVFAPNNEAFAAYLQANGYGSLDQVPAAALENLVNYHIGLGSYVAERLDSARLISTLGEAKIFIYNSNNSISLNGEAQVIQPDLSGRNGVVHILDGVLTPPTQTLGQYISSRATAENPEFNLLQAAIERAGLTTLLNSNSQPYTLLAPTNAAFTAAGYASPEDIANEDPAVLQNILSYHLLPAYRFSFAFRNQEVVTRQGNRVQVDATNKTVKGIGNTEAAALIAAEQDVLAINGIVHAINQVLLPE